MIPVQLLHETNLDLNEPNFKIFTKLFKQPLTILPVVFTCEFIFTLRGSHKLSERLKIEHYVNTRM
jgi:hypothetical protein